MSQELKDLKIKTNTVKLLLGDLKMSDKEIAQQKARIEKVKADAEKDDHDTRAQVDPVGRGVSIFLSGTKTGRRQGVMVAWHYSWYLFLLCPPVSC